MKNFNFFNQLFGTEGSPNQTGKTLTRENRIGLMSYLRRTLMLLFAVLVMSVANVGTAWGETQVTFTANATSGQRGYVNSNDVDTLIRGQVTLKLDSLGSATASKQIYNSSATKEASWVLSTSATSDANKNYIELKASSGYNITGMQIRLASNGSTASRCIAVCFASAFSMENNSVLDTISIPLLSNANDNSASHTITLSGIPSGTGCIRIYKAVRYDGTNKKLVNSKGTTIWASSSPQTAVIPWIKVTYEAAAATTYTLTYDANGGSVDPTSATQASAGASLTLPTPTRTGYRCTGWYTETSGGTKRGDGGDSYTPTANETLHAQWAVNWKFMYNGDSYAEHTFNSSYEWTQELDGNTTYWFRFSDGGSTVYRLNSEGTMNSGDCTGWWMMPNKSTDCGITTTASGTYTFTIDDSDPTNKLVLNVTYPSSVAITVNLNGHGDNYTWYAATGGTIPALADPSDTGYKFKGWYTDASCTAGNEWDFSTTVNSAMTLYAKWINCYIYYGDNLSGGFSDHDMTESADGLYWYWSVIPWNANRYFKIKHNGITYDLDSNHPYFQCTDINTNSSANAWDKTEYKNCAVYYNGASNPYYILVYVPNTTINTTDYPKICASTFLPESSYAVSAGHKVYFDNSARGWENVDFRIGHKCWTNKIDMTKVNGTDNLYECTTTDFGDYNAFHVADNAAWTGANNIYAVRPGNYDIDNALVFQKYVIDGDITLTPGAADGDPVGGCQYYSASHMSGMKTDRVTISDYTNGTITVTYDDADGTNNKTFTSGYKDLAHTVILKSITAVGATGYDASAITINGGAYSANYVVTGNTTIAASFTPQTYSITYKDQGNVAFSGTHTDTPSAHPTSHTYNTTTTLNSATKTGYTFGGWYTSPDCSTGLVTSLGATAYTADITLYAKWTATAPAGDCGEIIKSTFSGTKQSAVSTTTFNTTGEIGGTSTSAIIGSDGKLNEEGAYLILKLSTGTFLAGDTIKINSDKSGGVKFTTGTVSTQTYTLIGTASTATSGGQPYYFVLAANADSIIVPRGSDKSDYNQNPKIAYVSVCRPCPECDAAPAAPTATSNGATAATTQVVSWTDGSNDKWDVYVSTSNSTPAAGDTPTASGLTAKTYTFTGLAASTTYYWWVRSVCDATHKSAWVAGTNFETSAASEEPIPALISYYLQMPNKSTTPPSLSTDSIITTPTRLKGDTLKNFVPVTLGSKLRITGPGKDEKNSKYTAKIGKVPADSTTTAANEIKLAFDVHDDYELNISSITLTGLTVGNGNTLTYRAQLSDGVASAVGRIATTGGGEDRTVVFESFSGKKFSGTVTLSLWVWGVDSGEYRLKSPIQIDGTLTRKVSACTMPTQTFTADAYTLGDPALDLSTLFTSNSDGAVTYSVVNAGGTSATIVGSSFTASNTGTATIRATQAADGENNKCAKSIETTITVSGTCTPQSLSKVSATKGTGGTVTGYNDGQYAGDAVVNLYSKSPQSASLSGVGTVDGYKMGDDGTSIVFATLKGTSFQVGDKVKIGITKKSDNRTVDASTDILTIYYGTSKTDATALHTITGVTGAGFYEYALTSADVTAIGSKKGIGLFRESSNGENPFVYSVEIIGCREWAVCTAPNAVAASGATHNSAVLTVTDAEETGNYEFYYSESSTAPTASTAATATGSSLTKTITGLSASTTYYYWVRSNCGGVTKSAWVPGTPATFATTAAPSTYSVTYSATDKTSGSVPEDASTYEEGDVVTVKGNTGSLEKTGSSFVGWNTASDGTGTFYPAGYKFYMDDDNVTLYAVWGSVGATCVTLTNFATSSSTSSVPDGQSRYFYGYPNSSMSDEDRILITTDGNSDCRGQSEGTIMRLNYGKKIRIYSSSSTTTYSGITAISFKWRFYSTGNGGKTEETSSYTVKVVGGSTTTVANAVSITGKSNDDYRTVNITGLSSLNGYVEITAGGSSSNHHLYLDDIQICYGSGASSGYTVSFNMKDHGSAIADIENVPSGSKIGAPVPAPTATDWEFGGWYKETGCTNAWDFGTMTITKDTTLYAKWGNCAPTITTHPVAANYNQNGVAAALTVAANNNGGGELHYQWWVKENDSADEDGSVIPGETGNSYTPSTVLLGTSYYYCVVSNDCGNVKTNTAAVTIRDAKPAPTAVWDVEEPTHGGKGFTFSVVAKQNDEETLWDGTLTADMLSVSSEAVLGTVNADNDSKAISGTYGVKGSATSPVTFYLLLPATETQAAARLDHDQSFDVCVGGDGFTHDIRVLKANKNITFGGGTVYGWDNPGQGFLTANTGGTVSTTKAGTKMESAFDTVYNTNKKAFWVMPYAAGIKKIKVYGDVRVKELVVSNVRKVKAFTSGKDANNIAFSAAYEGGGDNVASTGYHWFEIILEDALDANDIIYFTVSENFQISGIRVTEAGSGGSLDTSLEWSNSDATDGTVNKNEGDADFSITATRSGTNAGNSNASLGAISYNSSKPEVATVDAATGKIHIVAAGTTVIKATLAASGCYKKAEITYSLVVAEYVCAEKAGTVRIKSEPDCAHKELTVTDYEGGADTFQWYKDGEVITGATSHDYTATASGTYSVSTEKTCAVMSANSITLTFDAATATKIVDEWYVKNGRRTPDIALVQTKNATGFTVTTGSPASDITSTGIGGCTFELKKDGIIYLHGTTSTGAAPSGMTPGDMTITITATACSNATPLDIVLHIQAETTKPSVAFVVDGTLRKDGGTATSVLAAKTSDRPLWKYLANTFALTGCNAYWSVDSKELRQYYSQFDAILITDDPSTDTKGTGGVSYVKAFGTMVDVRPVLTMEAYVGKFKDGGWHVYDATPTSPNPRQVELKLECKNHDIFKGLNPATSDNVRTTTDEYGNEYWHVIMVDTTQSPYHNTKESYEALPALQGFDRTKFSNMLGVGTIFEEKLQGGVERQEEPAARMMILGIQNNAMGALTNEGKLIVKNAIEYLLKTNMEDVNDCANYFTNAGGDGQWSTGANWTRGEVPDFETRARILQPVTIGNGTTAIAARVDIAASGESKHVDGECTGSITIEPQGILKVGGKVTRAKAPNFGIDNLQPTQPEDLYLKTNTSYQSALIFDNSDGNTQAVVQVYSKAHKDGDNRHWQYLTSPLMQAPVTEFFYGIGTYTFKYDEAQNGWVRYNLGTTFEAFDAIGLTQNETKDFVFYGPLASTEDRELDLTNVHNGENMFGNSWTAPLQLTQFDDDDFEGDIEKTFYVYNTGFDAEEGTGAHTNASNTPGEWQSIPLSSLEVLTGVGAWEGLKVVPAYQAFYVKCTSAGTITLNYDKHVRPATHDVNESLRAPKRAMSVKMDVLGMRISVENTSRRSSIYLLEDENFTEGFDNGWDGDYFSGDANVSRFYSVSPLGRMAVSALPNLDGTALGFEPASMNEEYTFTFYCDEDKYYLNDLKMETSTPIRTGESYTFMSEEGDGANRFYISATPFASPQITTGSENLDAAAPKVQKIIYNDKLYIIRGGKVYSAEGQLVK